ncbi:MAG: serine/threonine protein kinase, partial [Myxococcales bacterium]|nr:serine/threonine protein kinase [Myxococcales bacterium]
MEEPVPKKIGRYRVDRLLGAGAMGMVYLGRDPDLDRAVAIKTIRHLSIPPEAREHFLERFRNEARAAAQLQHPNIVQVYDMGEDERVGAYLVFEYVAGSTLRQVLRSRVALGGEDLVRLAEEIAAGLEVAHERGIIHRDIKPDNLLVTPTGQSKLGDFGIARVPNAALTREGQFLGTPCYAAPETIDGGAYSIRSDLFSFAAVLYEAASGVRAFPGSDAIVVAHDILHKHPPPPSAVALAGAIPAALDEVILRGIAKDPEERWLDPREMAEAIREALERSGQIADSSIAPPARAPGRGLGFAALLLGGLVVGVGLVFAFSGASGIEA